MIQQSPIVAGGNGNPTQGPNTYQQQPIRIDIQSPSAKMPLQQQMPQDQQHQQQYFMQVRLTSNINFSKLN